MAEGITENQIVGISSVGGAIVRLGSEDSAVYLGDTLAAGNNTAIYVEDAISYIQLYCDPAGVGQCDLSMDATAEDGKGSIALNVSGSGGVIALGGTGQKIVLAGLPTSNPARAGQLWNDGGTLKVSAG